MTVWVAMLTRNGVPIEEGSQMVDHDDVEQIYRIISLGLMRNWL